MAFSSMLKKNIYGRLLLALQLVCLLNSLNVVGAPNDKIPKVFKSAKYIENHVYDKKERNSNPRRDLLHVHL